MKHTPGPWKVREPDHFVDGLAHMVVSEHPQEGYWHIAEMGAHNGRAESEANARLIAAAPEMLEALIVLLNWPLKSECYDGSISKSAGESLANARRFARTIIAKAEGTEV